MPQVWLYKMGGMAAKAFRHGEATTGGSAGFYGPVPLLSRILRLDGICRRAEMENIDASALD